MHSYMENHDMVAVLCATGPSTPAAVLGLIDGRAVLINGRARAHQWTLSFAQQVLLHPEPEAQDLKSVRIHIYLHTFMY